MRTAHWLHYDFKTKGDKVDTQQIESLSPEKIDWLLNNAYLMYVDKKSDVTEVTQELIDTLGELVYTSPGKQPALTSTVVSGIDYMYEVELSGLDKEYYTLLRVAPVLKKGDCTATGSVFTARHNDLTSILKSDFNKPSFDFREVPIILSRESGADDAKSIYLFTDGTFEIGDVYISYIKQPARIWIGSYTLYEDLYNAQGDVIYTQGTDAPVGCELNDKACDEIVDIAVTEFFRMLQRGDLTELNLNKQLIDQ